MSAPVTISRDQALEAAWDEAHRRWRIWRDMEDGSLHWCTVWNEEDLHGTSGSNHEDAREMARQDAVEALRALFGLVIGP